MKKTTLTLWIAVSGSLLAGCGQGRSTSQAANNPSLSNDPSTLTGSSTGTSLNPPVVKKSTATRALIYSGPGACPEGCAQAAHDMAVRSGLIPTYVGPTDLNSGSTDAEKQALFQDVAVWLQPGGVSNTVLQSMTATMIDTIRSYVSNGGGYVGFCAGAFSSTKMVGTTSTLGFDVFPGSTIFYDSAPSSAAMLNIQWEGKARDIYWEGGPYITDLPADGTAEAVAYYPTGQIAAAKSSYGKGKVFITGFHPEAPQAWRDYYGMKDTDGLDFDLVDEMINWVK